jgi:hypothetical protein
MYKLVRSYVAQASHQRIRTLHSSGLGGVLSSRHRRMCTCGSHIEDQATGCEYELPPIRNELNMNLD